VDWERFFGNWKAERDPDSRGLALLLWWDNLRLEYSLWINWVLIMAKCTYLWELEDGSLAKY